MRMLCNNDNPTPDESVWPVYNDDQPQICYDHLVNKCARVNWLEHAIKIAL